jgi:hypothetical protein
MTSIRIGLYSYLPLCMTASEMLSPGHEPNEFVEADGTVSILVNHLDQFLRTKATIASQQFL